MGSTRQHSHLTPIKIFNDSFGTDQQSQLNLSSPLDNAPSLQPAGNVLGPKRDTNSKIIPSSQAGRSPSKPGPHTSSPPLKHVLTSAPTVSFPTPKTGGHGTDSLIKKPSPASYQSIAPHMSQLNSSGGRRGGGSSVMFPSSGGIDKENAPYNSSDNFTEFPGPEYAPKGLNKRPLASSNAHEEPSSKAPRLTAPTRIPEPHEMPDIVDDGRKPRYTYAQLCAMAILRSPQRKLTLASIYEWIHNTFAFYREATASGWQNSIRHNLSLHKAFSKVERPRNDPGKGNYWVIEQDMVADFLEEKHSRRPASSSTSHRPSSRPSSSHGPPLPGPILAPMQPPPQQQQQPQQSQMKQLQQQQAQEQEVPGRQPMQPPPSRRVSTSAGSQSQLQTSRPQAAPAAAAAAEPSSDATIPLSDPALLVEDGEDAWVDIARPSSRARQSSPQPPMHSSPPVAHLRSRASTGAGNDLLSSTHGSKKRKRVSMNDSGYYSSLESSAMRRPHSRAGLDSIASNRKRGRAEEEIARLRSSSQDISPSKPPYLGVPRHSTPGLLSSSPTRPTDRPLTPGIGLSKTTKLRKPKISAPTLSPDTQLANHRNKVNQLFGTPLKGEANGLIADFMTPQSQSFNLLDDPFDVSNLSPGIRFDVFEDQSPLKRRALAAARSPEKLRSASRPGLSRSNTTPARALGDVTRTASNRPSPLGLKPPVKLMSRLGSPLRFTSPEKPSNPAPAALAANDNNMMLTSSPANNSFASIFGAACKSPVKLGSPFSKQLEELYFGDAAKAFDFSTTTEPDTFFDMFADEKNASPIDGSCPEIGFDLAGDFRKINGGGGVDVEAFNDKENTSQQQQQPAKRQRFSPTKSRPGLGGRSSTSLM